MGQTNYQGALQYPINSGFSSASTAEEVIKGIDLKGKNAIVTGGYAGIGLETVKAFVKAGAQVIVPARDMEKAKKNLKGVKAVQLEKMDLMDAASIEAFSAKIIQSGQPLHLLINNAGIMWVPLQRDSRGYESQLSTNHLGHFQLTAQLWPALVKANGARVVNVSSWGHHFARFNFEDPNFERREYLSLEGYGQSKTANILFALELDVRGRNAGVRAYSLHPGAIVETDLKRLLTKEELISIGVYDIDGKIIRDPSKGLKTIAQGASTTVWAATSPHLNNIGGVYCDNTEVAKLDLLSGDAMRDFARLARIEGVTPYALDEDAAKQLWNVSELLTGVQFEI